MVDRALGEAPAHGEPGVAGADDDGRDANGTAPDRVTRSVQFTSTVTFVGLVTMS